MAGCCLGGEDKVVPPDVILLLWRGGVGARRLVEDALKYRWLWHRLSGVSVEGCPRKRESERGRWVEERLLAVGGRGVNASACVRHFSKKTATEEGRGIAGDGSGSAPFRASRHSHSQSPGTRPRKTSSIQNTTFIPGGRTTKQNSLPLQQQQQPRPELAP
jgi:hypothetical protein